MALMPGRRRRTVAVLLLASLCACTSLENRDPFEPVNRAAYGFNERLDTWLLVPLARGYATVVPQPVRTGVSNVFDNLRTVDSILAAALQAKPRAAASDTSRFLVNSTLGLAGLIDVASDMGIEPAQEDLGQTLAVWGWNRSPYLVLPVLGPNAMADVPDAILQRVFVSGVFYGFPVTANATDGISQRAENLAATKARDTAALDAYTFTREAYLARRTFLIHDGNPPLDDPLDDLDF